MRSCSEGMELLVRFAPITDFLFGWSEHFDGLAAAKAVPFADFLHEVCWRVRATLPRFALILFPHGRVPWFCRQSMFFTAFYGPVETCQPRDHEPLISVALILPDEPPKPISKIGCAPSVSLAS